MRRACRICNPIDKSLNYRGFSLVGKSPTRNFSVHGDSAPLGNLVLVTGAVTSPDIVDEPVNQRVALRPGSCPLLASSYLRYSRSTRIHVVFGTTVL
jgi:hypothetical protein